MKKFLFLAAAVVTFFAVFSVSAAAVTNDTVKVGLRYSGSALSAANLENAVGSGYALGYYDSSRNFVPLGQTAWKAITMSVSDGYHIQLSQSYSTFGEAAAAAAGYTGGYPAYISGAFAVRIGSYSTNSAASAALTGLGVAGTVASPSTTGVTVSETSGTTPLFEFDCQGAQSLGVQPDGQGNKAATWFKGYRYNGGFEYARITGGNINVINVVGLEDYVRGVIPYEMSGDWPAAALEAQAVCARTYVCQTTKHLSAWGFDVCNTTDCQVYNGVGSGAAYATSVSDSAVDATAGKCLYSNGSLIEALYFSCDGGATEDSENVFGGATSYLVGKADPYEATISIPSYSYTVSYTPAQLTWILQNSGYSIGTVQNVYVSEFTKNGNAGKVTFTDTAGKTLTLKGDKARAAFYSKTYGKSVRSMRFTISGGTSSAYYVNGTSSTLDSVSGAYAISGTGSVGALGASGTYVITSSGKAALQSSASTSSSGEFVVTGTGNGHNVGMSQYGAYAMAKQGLSYEDILNFYYTGVTIG